MMCKKHIQISKFGDLPVGWFRAFKTRCAGPILAGGPLETLYSQFFLWVKNYIKCLFWNSFCVFHFSSMTSCSIPGKPAVWWKGSSNSALWLYCAELRLILTALQDAVVITSDFRSSFLRGIVRERTYFCHYYKQRISYYTLGKTNEFIIKKKVYILYILLLRGKANSVVFLKMST